jgi:UDP-N-acetylglucosamine--N-acetylmuramyl-(pentapeptide) pyrophosphoryl-undecaprenol N-acetylglucosamine transferase
MKIIITGSATGGHLYPAIAIADKICMEDKASKVLFIGAKNEVGTDIIKSTGYELETVNLRGFDRKAVHKNVGVVKDVLLADIKLKKILKEFMPDGVISTGGYTGGPVVRAAASLGIPTFIHEQNVVPGVSNKLAAKYATRIYLGFTEAKANFKKKYSSKTLAVGNPVRNDFNLARQIDYRKKMEISEKKRVLLVFGGSQGAATLNALGLKLCEKYKDDKDQVIFFITGKKNYWEVLQDLEGKIGHPENIHILDYMLAIHEIFSVADLIISRSGALSVSEIAYMGKPSILIPSPNVTANHQYFNAKTLMDAGAAIAIEEKDIDIDSLLEKIDEILKDDSLKNKMGKNADSLAKRDAVDKIYKDIKKYV